MKTLHKTNTNIRFTAAALSSQKTLVEIMVNSNDDRTSNSYNYDQMGHVIDLKMCNLREIIGFLVKIQLYVNL